MPLFKCANPKCSRVLKRIGGYCSARCVEQVKKQERLAKLAARRKEEEKGKD